MHFDAKKINKFNRTIRFTGRTVGSFYPILIHPISGPIFKIIVKSEFRFGLYTKTHKTAAVVEGSNPPTEAGKWLNFELTALTAMSKGLQRAGRAVNRRPAAQLGSDLWAR